MGRIRPAWYYTRQAQQATARQTYLTNRQPPAEGTTIDERGASTDLFYRSLNMREGTDHLTYKVSVLNTTLSLMSATDSGLVTNLPANTIALNMRGSGVKPTRLHWYKGATTPTRKRSPWGTSWVKYYDEAGGRSHYSVPFSRATGVFDGGDLQGQFEALFGPGGSKRGLLGTKNGRAYFEFEQVRPSFQS